MKIDSGGYPATVLEAADGAAAAETDGFDGYWAPEVQIDAAMACAAAAARTERIDLGTGIMVAFARNPMTVALQANDLQLLTGGRFLLGLGSQIKPHITRRFSMPWTHPAPRMAEFIRAIRAIWAAWAGDGKLDFAGDFYTHTLMTPFFNPGPNPHGNPPILLAGVGPKMTETAGEVADGFVSHGFQTARYMREVTVPALERGLATAGRSMDDFTVTMPVFAVAADTEEQMEQGLAMVRGQIGFYGSTPAYRPVLELHGWGELQDQLNAMTKQELWANLSAVIPDEVVHEFAIVGTPTEVATTARHRFAGMCSRLTLKLDHLTPESRATAMNILRDPVQA